VTKNIVARLPEFCSRITAGKSLLKQVFQKDEVLRRDFIRRKIQVWGKNKGIIFQLGQWQRHEYICRNELYIKGNTHRHLLKTVHPR
jgi:hypothetical protein